MKEVAGRAKTGRLAVGVAEGVVPVDQKPSPAALHHHMMGAPSPSPQIAPPSSLSHHVSTTNSGQIVVSAGKTMTSSTMAPVSVSSVHPVSVVVSTPGPSQHVHSMHHQHQPSPNSEHQAQQHYHQSNQMHNHGHHSPAAQPAQHIQRNPVHMHQQPFLHGEHSCQSF